MLDRLEQRLPSLSCLCQPGANVSDLTYGQTPATLKGHQASSIVHMVRAAMPGVPGLPAVVLPVVTASEPARSAKKHTSWALKTFSGCKP